MPKDSPETTYLRDYQIPSHLIDTVDLQFELDDTATKVSAHLEIHANPERGDAVTDLVLDGEALTLESIAMDGVPLTPEQYVLTDTSLTIKNVPAKFNLDIKTQINPKDNTSLEGLYKSNGNFTTQCEAEGFRRITYFLDQPDVLARYTTTIIADPKQYPVLLSNGNLIDQGLTDTGKKWIKWADPFKKPSYLFALVAGDFELVEDRYLTQSGRTIKLYLFAEKGYGARCMHAMQAVKKAMKWDEDNYGREYDLDDYKIVAVSDFNAGAMENKGLNIFNAKRILATPATATDQDHQQIASTIGHEYFHNWTGNRVTCREWFQLSLKEGLTTFRQQSFDQDISSVAARIGAVDILRNHQFIEDEGPLSHPVQPQEYIQIDNFYTTTIYKKGAEIYRMLQTTLGKALFRKGMDLYFERFDGQAVRIEDFIQVMADASGRDLSQFLLWFHQAGTPRLDITDEYDPLNETYTLKIKQSCQPTPGQAEKKPLAIPITIGLLDAQGVSIPLHLTGSESIENEKVLLLTKSEEVFRFTHVPSYPTPSLLRGFSAPVRMHYAYSDADLVLLAKSDTDLFNRCEAGRKYISNCLLGLVSDVQQGKPLSLSKEFLDTYRSLLHTKLDDLQILAKMVELPTENELANQMDVVDVDGIHEVLQFVTAELAKACKVDLMELYVTYHTAEYPQEYQGQDAGKRALKNIALNFLKKSDDPEVIGQIMTQFKQSLGKNMTDNIAALNTLMDKDCQERTDALAQFYEQWQNDSQILGFWFTAQAAAIAPDTFDKVKALMKHPAFDITNPNKLFSLIGPWTNNSSSFHVASGEGYQFLTDLVLQLDSINPQSAARAVNPLTKWTRYDSKRQELMCEQLQRLLQAPNLSKNVQEVVAKSLEARTQQLEQEDDLAALIHSAEEQFDYYVRPVVNRVGAAMSSLFACGLFGGIRSTTPVDEQQEELEVDSTSSLP